MQTHSNQDCFLRAKAIYTMNKQAGKYSTILKWLQKGVSHVGRNKGAYTLGSMVAFPELTRAVLKRPMQAVADSMGDSLVANIDRTGDAVGRNIVKSTDTALSQQAKVNTAISNTMQPVMEGVEQLGVSMAKGMRGPMEQLVFTAAGSTVGAGAAGLLAKILMEKVLPKYYNKRINKSTRDLITILAAGGGGLLGGFAGRKLGATYGTDAA